MVFLMAQTGSKQTSLTGWWLQWANPLKKKEFVNEDHHPMPIVEQHGIFSASLAWNQDDSRLNLQENRRTLTSISWAPACFVTIQRWWASSKRSPELICRLRSTWSSTNHLCIKSRGHPSLPKTTNSKINHGFNFSLKSPNTSKNQSKSQETLDWSDTKSNTEASYLSIPPKIHSTTSKGPWGLPF